MPNEVQAFVGLGSNLGDRVATLDAALTAIAALPGTRLVARSSLWESAPIGVAGVAEVPSRGSDYVNAVARIETALDPHALLRALQAIEARHGRERPFVNAPRTLDLDLLLHGESVVDDALLTLPHPRMRERAFVLLPLREVAPRLRLGGEPIEAWLARLGPQRIAKLDR